MDIIKKRQRQKEYKKSKEGKITQAKYYKSEAKKESNRRWRMKPENKIKRKAHNFIFIRVKSGKIKKEPCEICGKKKAQAHHDDYEKISVIRWLCNFHHTEYHRKLKLQELGSEVIFNE